MQQKSETSLHVAALVPMRHDSERVPGKNYRQFVDRPLFHHILQTLLACERVDEVVVDTDSPVIRLDVQQRFPSVRVLERPDHLRAGTVPMNAVILHDVAQVEADLYVQTHSTNPLLSSSTIDRAITTYEQGLGQHDALMSVTRLQGRVWDAAGRAVNHDPAVLLRTQDLQPLYLENSCLYLFSRSTLEQTGRRNGLHPLYFELPALEAWDIDEESDFVLGEILCQALAAR